MGGDRGVWQIVDLQLFTLIIYIYNFGILTNLQSFLEKIYNNNQKIDKIYIYI